jgi:hypothetical protein
MNTEEKLVLNDRETLKHIKKVAHNIGLVTKELDKRAEIHDASKMEEPERGIMAEHVPLLGNTTYGTPEYDALLEKIRPALDHHYANNRHHPEFHKNGINDMDLIDILEMLCDWKAATERNKNGNIRKSIEINAKRFKIDSQLAQILENTVERYF